MAFDLIHAGVATAVQKNGTVTFAYPSGRDKDSYVGGGEVLVIPTHQSVLTVGAGKFSVTYGASDITVTYLGELDIPAGTLLTLQSGLVPTAFSEIPGKVADATGDNLQEILEDLASRITALE